MLILGLSPLDKDSTVSLHEDGKITWAIGEERLTRLKLQGGFPHLALDEVCRRAGIKPNEVDKIAYPFWEGRREAQMIWEGFWMELSRATGASLKNCHRALSRIATGGRVPSPGLAVRFEGYEDYMEKDGIRQALYRLTSSTALADRLTHLVRYWRWTMRSAQEHRELSDELDRELKKRGLFDKLVRVEHHPAHAARRSRSSSARATRTPSARTTSSSRRRSASSRTDTRARSSASRRTGIRTSC